MQDTWRSWSGKLVPGTLADINVLPVCSRCGSLSMDPRPIDVGTLVEGGPETYRCRACSFTMRTEGDAVLRSMIADPSPVGPLARAFADVRAARVAALRRHVQSIECGSERFETRGEAARWVREHDFRADRGRETHSGYAFDQRPIGESPVRRIRLEEDVTARLDSPSKT